MRKTSTILASLLLTITICAQSPNKLSYQAVVRDADNNLVTEESVGMQISILQSSASGTAVYTETHTPTTNANGLATIEIGGGATTDDFSTIDWAAGPYFIKTEIDPAGGINYSITGTSQILSVPYAKYADKAGNAFSGDYGDLSGSPTNVSEFTNDAGYLTEVTGSEVAFDGWDKDEDSWQMNGNNVYYNDGYIAIGTDTADLPLVVTSGANSSYIVTRNNASGIEADNGFLTGIRTDLTSYVWNYEDGDIRFGTNDVTRMTIENDGDVGIGTTSPSASLDVEGDAKFGSAGIVFSELREITGTTSATLYYTHITLPSGYDENNTRVLSLHINYNNDRWSGLGHDNGPTNRSVGYIINDSQLTIYCPDIVNYKDVAFKALIMKIE